MSNLSRGKAFEIRIKKYLESMGFKVDKARASFRPVGPGKWISTPNDFFGAIDLMGVHPEKPYVLFIQCTLGDPTPRKIKIKGINWNLGVSRVQLWQRQEGFQSGIKVEELALDGTWREYIFRLKDGITCDPLEPVR